MSREKFFFLPEDAPPTFARDEKLEKLPLPKLEDTLERYFHNLLPFGTTDELDNSRRVIDTFKNGVGRKLQKLLEERAAKERNWVEQYWEDIAYHSLRLPLFYSNMALPFIIESVGVEENRENRLKTSARICYYSGKFWELIRKERLRPPANPDGSIIFSADLFKRLFNTCRVPGEEKDEIHEYFKTEAEGGDCPSTCIILGQGRVFYFNFYKDGQVITPQEFLHILTIAKATIENEPIRPGVPILTADERTSWAKNRNHLIEISTENAAALKIIESAATTISFDDSEPENYSDCAQKTLHGDFHSRWNDKTSSMITFANGRFGLAGEHSAYDGTVSIAFASFVLLSMLEEPEPDWEELPKLRILPTEVKFHLDDQLLKEISRMDEHSVEAQKTVVVQCQEFSSFGKSFMKKQKIHPDAFVQMGLQWTYYKLHKKLAPTYETGTMRVFYHGRTETVRSCSIEVKDWIETMMDPRATTSQKASSFKNATQAQNRLMNEARKGNGFDRHLFGLWCIAQENGIPTPDFYDDPLYTKSGGGGNFVLSTSTLGYSINVGFVAPMVNDGYGVFYSMLDDSVWIIVTCYRDSEVTSSKKFYEAFHSAMNEIKNILEASANAKL